MTKTTSACKSPGCGEAAAVRGVCKRCYDRFRHAVKRKVDEGSIGWTIEREFHWRFGLTMAEDAAAEPASAPEAPLPPPPLGQRLSLSPTVRGAIASLLEGGHLDVLLTPWAQRGDGSWVRCDLSKAAALVIEPMLRDGRWEVTVYAPGEDRSEDGAPCSWVGRWGTVDDHQAAADAVATSMGWVTL